MDSPPLPFYAELIDVAAALRGKEPLLKARTCQWAGCRAATVSCQLTLPAKF